jgi:hypothetical protein
MTSHLTTIGNSSLSYRKASILKSKPFKSTEKKSECKYGILLGRKDSKQSHKHIIKAPWALS